MNQIDIVKRNIAALYKSHKVVHANIRFPRHSRTEEQDLLSIVINAVYANVFEVKDINSTRPQTYTFQYVDVITKEIDIKEMEGVLPKIVDIKRPRQRNAKL